KPLRPQRLPQRPLRWISNGDVMVLGLKDWDQLSRLGDIISRRFFQGIGYEAGSHHNRSSENERSAMHSRHAVDRSPCPPGLVDLSQPRGTAAELSRTGG